MRTAAHRSTEFRRRSTLGVAVTGLVVLTPLAINNFIQGRAALGVGSLTIAIVMALLAAGCARGRYHPILTFAALVPTILAFLVLVFQWQGIIGALWCYPAALAFYCVLEERLAWIANVGLIATALPFALLVLDPAIALRFAITLVTVNVAAAIFVRVIMTQQQALEALAATDPLTGLANRMALMDELTRSAAQSRRKGQPLSLVALDVDHFKAINDRHGHAAGDAVLRDLGALLLKRLRKADRVFRLGGEEFLALLDATDAQGARGVAEELRAALSGHAFESGLEVTASFGVAELGGDEDADAWMRRADEMLYQAKAEGRNTVRG